VNLVAPEAADTFRQQLSALYNDRYQKTPAFYDCLPAEGAGLA